MTTFTLKNDDAPSVRFKGELIAERQNHFDRAFGSGGSGWSGRTGEQDLLDLYLTSGGNFVARKRVQTQWMNCDDTHAVKLCKTLPEVYAFLGYDRLAMELYELADITPVEETD